MRASLTLILVQTWFPTLQLWCTYCRRLECRWRAVGQGQMAASCVILASYSSGSRIWSIEHGQGWSGSLTHLKCSRMEGSWSSPNNSLLLLLASFFMQLCSEFPPTLLSLVRSREATLLLVPACCCQLVALASTLPAHWRHRQGWEDSDIQRRDKKTIEKKRARRHDICLTCCLLFKNPHC